MKELSTHKALEPKKSKEQESYTNQLSDLIYRHLKPSSATDINRVYCNEIAKEISKHFHLYGEVDITQLSFDCIKSQLSDIDITEDSFNVSNQIPSGKGLIDIKVSGTIDYDTPEIDRGTGCADDIELDIELTQLEVVYIDYGGEVLPFTVDMVLLEGLVIELVRGLQ